MPIINPANILTGRKDMRPELDEEVQRLWEISEGHCDPAFWSWDNCAWKGCGVKASVDGKWDADGVYYCPQHMEKGLKLWRKERVGIKPAVTQERML
jgi:hypothetical protein